MVGPSKILTVSYGTFSCTLEGFDDPFSTMRGIAEYFRDLAADDRYFGAEPPTPDAEMLHQIAQREVKRRVEAQVEDNGITLRQVEQQKAPAPAPVETYADDDTDENMFADIGVDASAPASDADDEAEAAQAASVSTYGDAEAVDTVPPAFDDNSVAAKLSRIRAVVSRGSTPQPAPTAFSGPIEAAFEGPAPAPASEPAEAPHSAEAQEPAQGDVPAPEPTPEPETAEAPAPVHEPEAVEAPVSETDEETVPEPPAAPVQEDAEQLQPEAIESSEAEMPESRPEEDEPEAAPAAEQPAVAANAAEGEAEIDPQTGYDEADPWAASPEEILSGEEAAEAPLEEPEKDTSLAARIVRLKEAAKTDANAHSAPEAAAEPAFEFQDAPASAEPEAPEAASGADEEAEMDEDALFAPFDAEEAEAEELSDTLEDLEAGDGDELEDDLDLDVDALVGRKTKEPELIEEPEPKKPAEFDADSIAAMKAAIAEATSEIGTHVAEEAPEEDEAPDADETDQKASAFEQREEPGDAAFDRILEQTNSRMDDSEGNRRRSAIAHLKAAVAATKADRLLKRIKQPEEQAAEEQSQYRDDLAKVVRPRRTATEPRDDKTERPEMIVEKASPLMLVSELRVNEDDADKADMIAPRRVASDAPEYAEGEVDAGFVEFAEKVGATELPDLLEAAAAYSAYVAGRKEFSRPDLMRTVASVDQGEFTREAGLRSFGQLLRQGKIQKLKRGQFTVTAETRFNPQARIAGE